MTHRLGVRALIGLLPGAAELARPRYQSLATEIGALLFDGRIAPNAALPSERDLAAGLGVSRSTTTAAYRLLAQDGLLTRRQGSGSVLTLPPGSRIAGPGARVRRPDDGAIDLSIAALPAEPGWLSAAATAAVADLAGYAGMIGYEPYGLPALRSLVAARFTERGVVTSDDQILITNGAQHGLDLVLRLLLNPGERVLTELPCYPGALDAIRYANGQVVSVRPRLTAAGTSLR
jgi:DNA-binding transcriptional MocR family regulator